MSRPRVQMPSLTGCRIELLLLISVVGCHQADVPLQDAPNIPRSVEIEGIRYFTTVDTVLPGEDVRGGLSASGDRGGRKIVLSGVNVRSDSIQRDLAGGCMMALALHHARDSSVRAYDPSRDRRLACQVDAVIARLGPRDTISGWSIPVGWILPDSLAPGPYYVVAQLSPEGDERDEILVGLMQLN